MLGRPPVLFPAMDTWAVGYLRAALTARQEPYTSGVTVRTAVGSTMPARLVTVRDDGGPRQDDVRKVSSLGINVWAGTEPDAADLALLIAALFEAAPGNGPVLAFDGATGPYPVPDQSGKPHRYLSVDFLIHGSPFV